MQSRAFSRFLSTLVVAEPTKGGAINPATLSALTAAKKLGQDVRFVCVCVCVEGVW